MNDFKKRIGVFDSGIGGINVLSNLVKAFPHEDFLYLGDNLNVPYGVKSKEDLELIIKRIFNFFEKEDVKAIMIACNTASIASRNLDSKVKVFRIIAPTAKRALEVSNNIAVVATDFTIKSNAYNEYLEGKMTGIKASPLVMVVENHTKDTKEGKKIIEEVLSPYKNKCDCAILGCTHFPFLYDEIKNGLNVKTIIDSSMSFNQVLKDYLDKENLNNDNTHKGKIEICFTKEDNIDLSFFNYPYDGIKFVKL